MQEHSTGQSGESGEIKKEEGMGEREESVRGDMDADLGDTTESDRPKEAGARMDEDSSDMDEV